jgi:hypothetical protein
MSRRNSFLQQKWILPAVEDVGVETRGFVNASSVVSVGVSGGGRETVECCFSVRPLSESLLVALVSRAGVEFRNFEWFHVVSALLARG